MRYLVYLIATLLIIQSSAFARDIEYANSEVSIYVNQGEPTQLTFPEEVKSGYKKNNSAVNVERRGNNLVIFAREELAINGEAIIVTLRNGKSYSVRVRPADALNSRDDQVRILDNTDFIYERVPEDPEYVTKEFEYAPSNSVSGFMREMAFVVEFGKSKIPGYRVSTRHRGEVVMDDGTMLATIDRIFIGSNYWGYVINTQNMVGSSMQINPASFRIDGTRAIMAQRWQLAPRALNAEQQLAGKDRAKIYIVAKAR